MSHRPEQPSATGEGENSEGYLVNVVPLLREPGSRLLVRLDEPLTEVRTTGAIAEAVVGELVVESMSDSLTVNGVLNLRWHGDCRRCLEPTTGVTDVLVAEIFERGATEGETFELTDDQVDLEPMVLELVYLALPLAPLCGDDCPGPAPDDYPTSVEGTETANGAEGDEADGARGGDPRWAVLDELDFGPEERKGPNSG